VALELGLAQLRSGLVEHGRGDTITYRATGPYRATQGPRLSRDWLVGGT